MTNFYHVKIHGERWLANKMINNEFIWIVYITKKYQKASKTTSIKLNRIPIALREIQFPSNVIKQVHILSRTSAAFENE